MTLAQKFGHNLKQERARRKLSQLDLSRRAGVSVSYVSMLERHQRSPPLDTVERIARALKVAPTTLLH
jgi:transcriptional regulator with XRE-family HTH domain